MLARWFRRSWTTQQWLCSCLCGAMGAVFTCCRTAQLQGRHVRIDPVRCVSITIRLDPACIVSAIYRSRYADMSPTVLYPRVLLKPDLYLIARKPRATKQFIHVLLPRKPATNSVAKCRLPRWDGCVNFSLMFILGRMVADAATELQKPDTEAT